MRHLRTAALVVLLSAAGTAIVATADSDIGRSIAAIVIPESQVTNLTTDLAAKAPLASPTFTGTPVVPGYLTTATAASTYAPLASPTLTTPTVNTSLNVQNGADSNDPTAGFTLRFGNNGAIGTRAGCSAYSFCWLQAIQDDGSNNLKTLKLNPNGGGVSVGADFSAVTTIYAATFQQTNANAAVLKGTAADGSGATGVALDNTNALSNATAKLVSFRSNGSEKAFVWADGSISSTTEDLLTSWWFNAAAATGSCPATGTGCIGHKLPGHAFTVTGVTTYASVASGGGAANTVLTITDGTNTCTATIPCNSAPPAGTSSAGLVRVSTANGSGTGCVYAANAALTVSVTTAGCTTTQPTLKNVDIVGKWQ